jgi:hypothetical protein
MKIKFLPFVISVIFSVLVYGCSNQEAPKEKQQSINGSNSSEETIDSTMLRNKNTDIAAIDINKDNKVFQCMMDHNVISDEPGVCIKCRMKLSEITVSAAQDNLNRFYND